MLALSDKLTHRLVAVALAIGLIALIALPVLTRLATFARSDLYSYVYLVPLISGYLVFCDRNRFPKTVQASPFLASILLSIALMATLLGTFAPLMPRGAAAEEFLPVNVFAFVTAVIGIVVLLLGRDVLRIFVFPLLFLYFMVPLPSLLLDGTVAFLRDATAVVTYGLMQLTGTPVMKEGAILMIPGLTLEVADECSGIRSTLVLLITATLAGKLLLRTGFRRALLVLLVIPLGVLRNSFRVLSIALLTIHWDPNIINGPLHHRGGPVFFVLSLAILLGILLLLRRSERDPFSGGAETPPEKR